MPIDISTTDYNLIRQHSIHQTPAHWNLSSNVDSYSAFDSCRSRTLCRCVHFRVRSRMHHFRYIHWVRAACRHLFGCCALTIPCVLGSPSGLQFNALCAGKQFPFVQQMKVESVNGDAFEVTTYTSHTMEQFYPACSFSSPDGCGVTSSEQCGIGAGVETFVILRCMTPNVTSCSLRYDIAMNCTEISTTSPPASAVTASSSSSVEASDASSTSSSNATKTSGSITQIGWKTIMSSCGVVLGLIVLLV